MRRAVIAVALAALAVGSAAPAVAGAGSSGTAAAPRQASDVEVRHDLTYRRVGGDDLKLDAYIPAGGGTRPGVMVIYAAAGSSAARSSRRLSRDSSPSRGSSRSR